MSTQSTTEGRLNFMSLITNLNDTSNFGILTPFLSTETITELFD